MCIEKKEGIILNMFWDLFLILLSTKTGNRNACIIHFSLLIISIMISPNN